MISNPVNLNKVASAAVTANNGINQKSNPSEHGKEISELAKAGPVDTLELGHKGQESFGTYKVDRQKLNQILLDFSKNTESFKEMVRSMIEKQGHEVKRVLEAIDKGETPIIEIDEETRGKAKEAISENGYWGVKETSARILDFAKTISGGDPSKIETLKNAFKEGFEKAKKAFGGELPEISQQTYERVMKGFEEWAGETV